MIVSAMVRATGDKAMRFEHLRHSFATYLLACVLMPRDGSFLALPGGLDEDCVSLARRDLILNRIAGHNRLGRSAVHVVSQLCGHGPVTTTLRWYTHMLDWSLGAYTNRRLLEPQLPVGSVRILFPQDGEVSFRADQSLRRADRRRRARDSDLTPSSSTGSFVQASDMVPALVPAAGEVHLMSIFASLRRSYAGSPGITTQVSPGVQFARSYPEPAAQQAISKVPNWSRVREALLASRGGEMASSAAKIAQAKAGDVKRWGKMADLISGPRREGEVRMRFQPKMSRAKLEKFNVERWRSEFPALPRGSTKKDMVDIIWERASSRIEDPDVKWALEEFCRFYSVDTGFASFQKRKDALRYYRGLARMGFEQALEVSLLSITGNRATFAASTLSKPAADSSSGVQVQPRSCEWLRWHLTEKLPKSLRPPQPTGADIWANKRWPRAVAIWINPNKIFGDTSAPEAKIDPHARYAIRFALTMLAIVGLDGIRTPDRRRGWIPGYGGYF